jgi:hypothetical protein
MAYFSNDPFEQEEHAIEFFEKLKTQMQEDITRKVRKTSSKSKKNLRRIYGILFQMPGM